MGRQRESSRGECHLTISAWTPTISGESRRANLAAEVRKVERHLSVSADPPARVRALMVNPRARFLAGERGELRFPEVNCILSPLSLASVRRHPNHISTFRKSLIFRCLL